MVSRRFLGETDGLPANRATTVPAAARGVFTSLGASACPWRLPATAHRPSAIPYRGSDHRGQHLRAVVNQTRQNTLSFEIDHLGVRARVIHHLGITANGRNFPSLIATAVAVGFADRSRGGEKPVV